MILVTGGAGFIGSNIVAALEERGEQVAVCDLFGHDAKWRNLQKRDLADVLPPDRLNGWLRRHRQELTAIVHMGAISATTATDADETLATNFSLSLKLLQWCAAWDVHFIYASSAATYGDGAVGFVDDDSRTHLAKLRPLNLYGWSKHLFDRKVAALRDADEPLPYQCVGLKFFNVYGPNEAHKGSMQSVVAGLYPKVSRGEPARLFKSYRPDYPDGGQLRDFVYVRDCAQVVLWLLEHPDVSGLFNVGTGAARSFADLAKATQAACGQSERIEFIEMPAELQSKYQYFTQADLTRLRAAGYTQPFTSLEDGVRDYVQTYLQQTDPYR